MPLVLLPGLLSSGCSATLPALPGEGGEVSDSAVETVTAAGEDGCPALYDQRILPVFHLEIDEAEWAGIISDYASGVKQYHPARFVYASGEDIEVDNAAVRLRGNPGFSWLGDKMQFVISFNEYDEDARFMGLRKLTLDSSWYDPTLIRDRLAYAYMRDHGIPAPCANNALLYINGEVYGLYKNIEFVDHEFLERNFGDNATGGLWKYGTQVTSNAEASDPALLSEFWSNTSVAWQEAHTDLEYNITEWATEAVIPHNDGYWCCSHNFYIYEHPERGLMFIPWDLDYSFDATPFWADPYSWYRGSNNQYHFDNVAGDAEWGPRLITALDEAVESYDPDLMAQRVGDWGEQIAEAFASDPMTNFSVAEHDSALERLAAYGHGRHAFLDARVDCKRGSETDSDGDGYSSCEDCDDGDPLINPGAEERCNQRDDDCNSHIDDAEECDTCEEHAFGDSRMLLCWYPRSWDEAQAECEAHDANLGYPRTGEDWYVIFIYTYWHTTYFDGIYWWWVGATDAASEGTWVDPQGEAVAPAWGGGAPNGGTAENCAAITPNSWYWEDGTCSYELPFICRLD
ncbi:MAG TPA: CotH kinase family protein [Myxococcota bacterium]|nr:CotH kinase family protein [Myxococcota bacterium]